MWTPKLGQMGRYVSVEVGSIQPDGLFSCLRRWRELRMKGECDERAGAARSWSAVRQDA
jgi:hypothetical protein